MSAELSFDSNIVQLLLIVGIIILVGGYLYYENLKIKNHLLEIEYKIEKLGGTFHSENIMDDSMETQFIPNVGNLNNIQMNPLSQGLMPELFPQPMESTNTIKEELPLEKVKDNKKSKVVKEDKVAKEDKVVKVNKVEEVKQDDEKEDAEWSDIDKLMKDDNINFDDVEDVKLNNEVDPLQSFSIDDMLKDISGDTPDVDDKDDLQVESSDTIIDIKSNVLDYDSMTVTELKQILVEKNLPVSGNKTKLIQRILDNK
jgi:hypothetical protein